MAAGTQLPPALLKYWSTGGAGGAKIGWGAPGGGDFERCVRLVQEEITSDGKPPLPDRVIKGMCATLHKINTGASPGHAPGEQH